MPVHITMEFPDATAMDAFWGWFLDGGGDDGALETMNENTGNSYCHEWDKKKGTVTFKEDEG